MGVPFRPTFQFQDQSAIYRSIQFLCYLFPGMSKLRIMSWSKFVPLYRIPSSSADSSVRSIASSPRLAFVGFFAAWCSDRRRRSQSALWFWGRLESSYGKSIALHSLDEVIALTYGIWRRGEFTFEKFSPIKKSFWKVVETSFSPEFSTAFWLHREVYRIRRKRVYTERKAVDLNCPSDFDFYNKFYETPYL